MKNNTKKYLKNLILKNTILEGWDDAGEIWDMNNDEGDEYDDQEWDDSLGSGKNTGKKKGKTPKFSPRRLPGTADSNNPDYWVVCVPQTDNTETIFVPANNCDIEVFAEDNKEWIDKLGILHQLEVKIADCSRSKTHRSIEKTVTGMVTGRGEGSSGEKLKASEKIRRSLNPILSGHFEKSEFAKEIEKRSIPAIVIKDRAHASQYTEATNHKVEFETRTYDNYKDPSGFLLASIGRLNGTPVPEGTFKRQYLARQFSPERRWDKGKKSKEEYYGKTDVYNLERYGLEQENVNVSVIMDLKIRGEMLENEDGNRWDWTISLSTEIGKKLKDDKRIKDGFKEDKEIEKTTTIPIPEGVKFGDEYVNSKGEGEYHTIMDYEPIVEGLVEVINQLKEEVVSIEAGEVLNRAAVDVKQLKEAKIRLLSKVLEKIKS